MSRSKFILRDRAAQGEELTLGLLYVSPQLDGVSFDGVEQGDIIRAGTGVLKIGGPNRFKEAAWKILAVFGITQKRLRADARARELGKEQGRSGSEVSLQDIVVSHSKFRWEITGISCAEWCRGLHFIIAGRSYKIERVDRFRRLMG